MTGSSVTTRKVCISPSSLLTRPVDQEAALIRLAFPKSSYTAMIAVLLPELCVDVLSSGNEFVTMSRRALGKLFERAIFSLMRLNAFGRIVTAWAP